MPNQSKKPANPNAVRRQVASVIKAVELLQKEYKAGSDRQNRIIYHKLATLKEMTKSTKMEDILMELVSLSKLLNCQEGEDRGFFPWLDNAFEVWFNEIQVNRTPEEEHTDWVHRHRNHICSDSIKVRKDEIFMGYCDPQKHNQNNFRKEDDTFYFDQHESLVINITDIWDSSQVASNVIDFFRFKQSIELLSKQKTDCLTIAEKTAQENDFDQYIKKTIALGLMDQDGNWNREKATENMIVVWVELYTEVNGFPDKRWSWAQKRWGLERLAQIRSRLYNEKNGDFVGRELVESVFIDDHKDVVEKLRRGYLKSIPKV